MTTFTKIYAASRTGAQILSDIQALGWDGLKVYLEEGSESADAHSGAGPLDGGGGGGIAAWGTQAGFASDGVQIDPGVTTIVFSALDNAVEVNELPGGFTCFVRNGLSDGTASDDGTNSDIAPTLGFAGGAGGAAGAGGGGGGGGAATLAGAGVDGVAGGAANGGAGGNDGGGAAGGGAGGNTGVDGHDATNGGGGGQGITKSGVGLAATTRTGASTRGGYVKIVGNVAAGGTPKSVGKMTGGMQSLAGGLNG